MWLGNRSGFSDDYPVTLAVRKVMISDPCLKKLVAWHPDFYEE